MDRKKKFQSSPSQIHVQLYLCSHRTVNSVPQAAGSSGDGLLRRQSQALLRGTQQAQVRASQTVRQKGKRVFLVKVVKQCSRCPKAVKSPSLEKLKTLLDHPWATSPNTEAGPAQAGGWTRRPPEAPSNLEYFTIFDQMVAGGRGVSQRET